MMTHPSGKGVGPFGSAVMSLTVVQANEEASVLRCDVGGSHPPWATLPGDPLNSPFFSQISGYLLG